MSVTTGIQSHADPATQALCAGPLGRGGGVAVFAGLPPADICGALAWEARAAYAKADRQEAPRGDDEDGRGGRPGRALLTAGGGAVQDELYAAPWLPAFLGELCGAPIVPSGNRGSYSYYVQPGDHLDTHLDVLTCDVTVITVLHDDTDPNDPGGGLAVYPHHMGVPLRQVRAAPDGGVSLVKAAPGHSIVILGGLVPHRVVPIGAHGQRIISALCFEARHGPP